MDNETQKIIEEQTKKLPEDVKQAITSVDFKTKLQEITKKQKLLIDQAAKLELETTLVMIGLEPMADYIDNLQREMELPPVRAKEVAMDVNELIFKPIRVSLQNMSEELKPTEEKVTKFTNTNEIHLNRDQILNEIENPDTIDKGKQSMTFSTPVSMPNPPQNIVPIKTTNIEIRPDQEIEILPGEEVKDLTKSVNTDILASKMTDTTIVSQQVVSAKPEIKLPELKKRPSSGIDPYREEIK